MSAEVGRERRRRGEPASWGGRRAARGPGSRAGSCSRGSLGAGTAGNSPHRPRGGGGGGGGSCAAVPSGASGCGAGKVLDGGTGRDGTRGEGLC